MALGAAPAPQTEQPDPPNDGRSGDTSPKKLANSLELGREQLSSGPNEGLNLILGALPLPQSMSIEGRP